MEKYIFYEVPAALSESYLTQSSWEPEIQPVEPIPTPPVDPSPPVLPPIRANVLAKRE